MYAGKDTEQEKGLDVDEDSEMIFSKLNRLVYYQPGNFNGSVEDFSISATCSVCYKSRAFPSGREMGPSKSIP